MSDILAAIASIDGSRACPTCEGQGLVRIDRTPTSAATFEYCRDCWGAGTLYRCQHCRGAGTVRHPRYGTWGCPEPDEACDACQGRGWL